MKPLKLTEKHKSKLLEMCGKLFPEYEFKWKYIRSHNSGFYGTTLVITEKDKCRYTSSYNEIHWFEFCLTYLLSRLAKFSMNVWNKGDCTETDIEIFKEEAVVPHIISLGKHPVDFLYKEFKDACKYARKCR